MYKEHISELNGMMLKYVFKNQMYMHMYMYDVYTCTYSGCSVRVFLSGDYEYLCRMYGLSGASGNGKAIYSTRIVFIVSYPDQTFSRTTLLLVVYYSEQCPQETPETMRKVPIKIIGDLDIRLRHVCVHWL